MRVVHVAQVHLDHVQLGIGGEGVGAVLRGAGELVAPLLRDVAQEFLRLQRGARAGAEQQLVHHLPGGGHGVHAVNVLRRVALGVDHHQHQLADGAGRQAHVAHAGAQAAVGQRAVEQAHHAQVVGQAAIDQVDVGARIRVQVAAHVRAEHARAVVGGAGVARRGARGPHQVHRRRALRRVVVQRDRAEQQRHSRRCRHRERQRHAAQVRADGQELVPRELERRAARQVGGGDQQLRLARALFQVAKGHAAVQRVELARQQVRAAEPGRAQLHHVGWQQGQVDEAALEVLAQEVALEARQPLGAMHGVVGGDDAAARHAADHVGGVQQVQAAPVPDEFGVAQLTQHAKAEGRRTRTAARQGDGHEHARVAPIGQAHGGGLAALQGLVDPGPQRRATGQQRGTRQQRRAAQPGAQHLCASSQAGRPPMWGRMSTAPAARSAAGVPCPAPCAPPGL